MGLSLHLLLILLLALEKAVSLEKQDGVRRHLSPGSLGHYF